MLLGVLNVCSEEELEASDDEDAFSNRGGGPEGIVPPELVAERRSDIKNKILAVGKMQRLYQLLRYVYTYPSGYFPRSHLFFVQ